LRSVTAQRQAKTILPRTLAVAGSLVAAEACQQRRYVVEERGCPGVPNRGGRLGREGTGAGKQGQNTPCPPANDSWHGSPQTAGGRWQAISGKADWGRQLNYSASLTGGQGGGKQKRPGAGRCLPCSLATMAQIDTPRSFTRKAGDGRLERLRGPLGHGRHAGR